MPAWLLFVLIGILGGVASGLFGVGGGIVIVPALIYWAGFSQHLATGTSLAVLRGDNERITIGRDTNGKISPLIYAIAVPIALLPTKFAPFVAFSLYVVVALIWVVPDVRIERTIAR